MNVRLLAVVAIGLLAAALLMRDLGGGAPPPLPPPRARPARPIRSTATPAPVVTRNVFEFGPRAVPEAAPRPAPPATPTLAPAIAPPEEPAVRLVGLVRKAGVVKAVLTVRGETMVVATGEAAGDYRVLAIDDDGVRLRAKDGTVVTLPAGGS